MKVEIVNFSPTELITENDLVFRRIGRICFVFGYCQVSSISVNAENVLGVLSITPYISIRDTIAVSELAWQSPESMQHIIISSLNAELKKSIIIRTNTNYQSKYLYGSYAFICSY